MYKHRYNLNLTSTPESSFSSAIEPTATISSPSSLTHIGIGVPQKRFLETAQSFAPSSLVRRKGHESQTHIERSLFDIQDASSIFLAYRTFVPHLQHSHKWSTSVPSFGASLYSSTFSMLLLVIPLSLSRPRCTNTASIFKPYSIQRRRTNRVSGQHEPKQQNPLTLKKKHCCQTRQKHGISQPKQPSHKRKKRQ